MIFTLVIIQAEITHHDTENELLLLNVRGSTGVEPLPSVGRTDVRVLEVGEVNGCRTVGCGESHRRVDYCVGVKYLVTLPGGLHRQEQGYEYHCQPTEEERHLIMKERAGPQ